MPPSQAGTRPPAGWTCWGKPPTPSTRRPSWTAAWPTPAGQLLDLYYTVKDLSGELASRLEDYESNDAELDEIEQRLDLIYKLKRKYGDTVEDVLAFGEKAREELERIQFSQEHHDRLQAEKPPAVRSGAGGPPRP